MRDTSAGSGFRRNCNRHEQCDSGHCEDITNGADDWLSWRPCNHLATRRQMRSPGRPTRRAIAISRATSSSCKGNWPKHYAQHRLLWANTVSNCSFLNGNHLNPAVRTFAGPFTLPFRQLAQPKSPKRSTSSTPTMMHCRFATSRDLWPGHSVEEKAHTTPYQVSRRDGAGSELKYRLLESTPTPNLKIRDYRKSRFGSSGWRPIRL